MKDFVYHNPTEVRFGRGVVASLGARVRAAGLSSVVVVAGGGAARRCGAFGDAVASLVAAGVAWTPCEGVRPNPDLDGVLRAVQALRDAGAGGFVAVGGGSVMDTAKAASVCALHDGDPWDHFTRRTTATAAVPVFTVPTLSGTGAEMNGTAVITNMAQQRKWSLRGPTPVAAFLDPVYQRDVPLALAVGCAVDAMTHVLEFAVAGTPCVDAKALDIPGGTYFMEETVLAQNEALLRSIIRSVEVLRRIPGDYAARASLAWAAGLGLCGLTGVGLGGGSWVSHALEHAVSGHFPQVPHGPALAVLFPCWMEEVASEHTPMFERLARNVWGVEGAVEGIRAMRATFDRWGAPRRLAAWGVGEDAIPGLVRAALEYPRPLGLAPERVERIFRNAL